MKVKVTIAPWLYIAINVLTALQAIGYQITDEDVERCIESALITEIG